MRYLLPLVFEVLLQQTAICCIATVAPKRTPICCSFRTPLRVAQSARRYDLGKRRAQRQCTWGTPRKLQQIGVCLRGRPLRGCRATSILQQIGVCLRGRPLRGSRATSILQQIAVCLRGRLLSGFETTFVRLRNDVRAVAKRRSRGCGATFVRQHISVCLRGDVHAAANRRLVLGDYFRGCETTFVLRQIAVR